MAAHQDLPNDPHTGQRMIRLGFVHIARAAGGYCGPDAIKYEPKFLKRMWQRITAQDKQNDS